MTRRLGRDRPRQNKQTLKYLVDYQLAYQQRTTVTIDYVYLT